MSVSFGARDKYVAPQKHFSKMGPGEGKQMKEALDEINKGAPLSEGGSDFYKLGYLTFPVLVPRGMTLPPLQTLKEFENRILINWPTGRARAAVLQLCIEPMNTKWPPTSAKAGPFKELVLSAFHAENFAAMHASLFSEAEAPTKFGPEFVKMYEIARNTKPTSP